MLSTLRRLLALVVTALYPSQAGAAISTLLGRALARLSFTRTASPAPSETIVGYVTDVEGNLSYFDRWVAESGVLRYREGTQDLELVHERAYFVYGGDVMDRGDGSLRLARRLVDLKKRYPERVVLLAGNRDLNKVRLTSELASDDLARPYNSIPGPFWDPKAPTLAQYLENLAAERAVPAAELDCRAERLRYYLRHTLGCPHTFEMRRSELALLANGGGRSDGTVGAGGAGGNRCETVNVVSDEEVVQSMLDDIRPPDKGERCGVLREYLGLSCIAACLGNTMFVHGAMSAL